MSLNAGTAVAYLDLDTSKFQIGIQSSYQQLKTFADNSQSAGDRLQSLGGVMTGVGGALTTGLTVPIVGAGVAMGVTAAKFETGIANINTLLDDTRNLDGYKDKIIELSNETGTNVGIMTDGMYQAISSLGDLGTETEGIFEVMAKSSKAGGAETADSVSLISAAMKGYGDVNIETAQTVSDLAFQTAKLGVTTFPEMAKSMQPLFPLSNALNISMEDLFGSMATLTGVTGNTAEVTTQLKAVFSNMIKPTESMQKLIEKYGYSNAQAMFQSEGLAGVLKILQKETGGNADKLGELFSSTEALTALMALTGSQFDSFIDKQGQMATATGATEKAFKKVSETTEDKFIRSINEAKNSAMELGTVVLPMANNLIDGFTDVVGAFNNLDDATKKNIVSIGGVVAATGPLLSVGGKLVTTTGKLVTVVNGVNSAIGGLGLAGLTSGLSALAVPLATVGSGFYIWHEAVDLANYSVTTSREEMSAMERVIADMTGKVTYSKDELVAMGLVYEDFNENISTEFQQSVKDMTTDIHEFGMSLGQINLDEVISEEEHNQFVSKVDSALQSAVQAIDSKSAEMQSGLRSAFSVDGVIDDNETSLLEWWNSRGTKEKQEAQKLRDEIHAIESAAFASGKELTPEEVAAIEKRYAQIKQIELEAQASNSYELEYAHQEFQNRMSTLDAEEAQKLLQQRAKQRDDEQLQIKTNYDTLIALAQENYSTMSEEEKRYSDETVARLQEAKQKELDLSGSYYEQDYQYAVKHNENLKDVINKFTGEILDHKDVEYYKQLVQATEYYEGLNSVTESGYKKMLNTTTGVYDDVYIKVNETTGKLEGVYNLNTQSVGTMTEENGKLLRDEVATWQQTAQGILTNCLVAGNATVNASGTIMDAWGNVIGKLVQVQDENGNTVSSIQDVNGTPIDIGENTQEVIDKLKSTQREVDNTNGKKANINVTDNGTAEAVKGNINSIPTYKQVVVGVVGGKYNGSTMYATGTDNALPGVASVAEYGPELIQSRSGALTLATGRQLFNMDGGETVYNARQTQEILNGMKSNSVSDGNLKSLEDLKKSMELLRDNYRDMSKAMIFMGEHIAKLPPVVDVELNIDGRELCHRIVEPMGEELADYIEKLRFY